MGDGSSECGSIKNGFLKELSTSMGNDEKQREGRRQRHWASRVVASVCNRSQAVDDANIAMEGNEKEWIGSLGDRGKERWS